MALQNIIDIIKEQRPEEDASIINQAHDLLKQEVQSFGFLDKKDIYEKAINKALTSAQDNAGLEFTTASLFFPLSMHRPDLPNILRKKISPGVGELVAAERYARQKLFSINRQTDFYHGYHTAKKLSEINMDSATVIAGLLHPVPLLVDNGLPDIRGFFDKEIIMLVEKFGRIENIKVASAKSQYARYLREMVLAMAEDLRVVIIKMCRNIDLLKMPPGSLAIDDLRALATESLEIFAPIADLLGMWRLRWQLEDYSFKILEPIEYEKISRRFNIDEKKNREKYIKKTKNILLKAAAEAKIPCRIDGRFKHFYSIFQKMKNRNKAFNDIYDVFALRVIVEDIDQCYRILGIIHGLWKPKPRRIKDYIADPKSNNYQSLHTSVIGVNGKLTEFQIRTRAMDEEAKFGIAAHWKYKNAQEHTPKWMKELLLRQQEFSDDNEFLSNFSSDILNSRIYIYTPKGDVISLPEGATPVDFAYHIHTEIGNKCSGAIVNEHPVPLDFKLSRGDIVEIITDRSQNGPNPQWLNFIKSRTARRFIEQSRRRAEVADDGNL